MNTDIHYWIGLVWNIYFLYALLITLVSMFIVSVRYRFMINYFKGSISTKDSFSVTTVTQLLSYLSPFTLGTFIFKPMVTSFFSKTHVKISFFVSFFEQAFEVMWQIAMLPLILLFLGERLLFNKVSYQIAIIVAFMLIFIILFIKHKQVIDLLWKLKILVPKGMKKVMKKLNFSKESANNLMKKALNCLSDWKLLLVVSLITLIFVLFSPLVISVLALSFNYNLSYFAAFSICWVSLIIGRLSGMPSGLASREVVMAGMLVAFNVNPIDSVKLAILARLASLIPLIIIGTPLLGYISTKIPFKRIIRG